METIGRVPLRDLLYRDFGVSKATLAFKNQSMTSKTCERGTF